MEIRLLLRSQANQVFEAIKSAGLQATDFDWRDATGHASMTRVSRLVHKASGYYFIFDNLGQFSANGSLVSKRLLIHGIGMIGKANWIVVAHGYPM